MAGNDGNAPKVSFCNKQSQALRPTNRQAIVSRLDPKRTGGHDLNRQAIFSRLDPKATGGHDLGKNVDCSPAEQNLSWIDSVLKRMDTEESTHDTLKTVEHTVATTSRAGKPPPKRPKSPKVYGKKKVTEKIKMAFPKKICSKKRQASPNRPDPQTTGGHVKKVQPGSTTNVNKRSTTCPDMAIPKIVEDRNAGEPLRKRHSAIADCLPTVLKRRQGRKQVTNTKRKTTSPDTAKRLHATPKTVQDTNATNSRAEKPLQKGSKDESVLVKRKTRRLDTARRLSATPKTVQGTNATNSRAAQPLRKRLAVTYSDEESSDIDYLPEAANASKRQTVSAPCTGVVVAITERTEYPYQWSAVNKNEPKKKGYHRDALSFTLAAELTKRLPKTLIEYCYIEYEWAAQTVRGLKLKVKRATDSLKDEPNAKDVKREKWLKKKAEAEELLGPFGAYWKLTGEVVRVEKLKNPQRGEREIIKIRLDDMENKQQNLFESWVDTTVAYGQIIQSVAQNTLKLQEKAKPDLEKATPDLEKATPDLEKAMPDLRKTAKKKKPPVGKVTPNLRNNPVSNQAPRYTPTSRSTTATPRNVVDLVFTSSDEDDDVLWD